jgi:CYTH domain-containing protein
VGQANILRKVGKNDAFTYSHEMRYEINGEKIQKKRQITAREYIELCENTDITKKKIIKTRQCFIYDRQYFMVETFLNLENHPSIIRVESTTEKSKTKLPPFLKIVREVTNDNAYETWMMANQDYEMPEDDVIAIQETLLAESAKEPALLLAKIHSA